MFNGVMLIQFNIEISISHMKSIIIYKNFGIFSGNQREGIGRRNIEQMFDNTELCNGYATAQECYAHA